MDIIDLTYLTISFACIIIASTYDSEYRFYITIILLLFSTLTMSLFLQHFQPINHMEQDIMNYLNP